MHTFLKIICTLTLVTGQLHAQDALGTGNALDNNLSTSGRENYRRTLPRGTTNREIRTNSILAGRDFNEGVGLGTRAHMQLIADAAAADSAVLADTMNNSPWYWENWDNQSAQFLFRGETNYYSPYFIDNWAQSPTKVRIGHSMQSINRNWSADDDNSDRSAVLNYPTSWSKRQMEQHRLTQATGATYDPSLGALHSMPIVGNMRTPDGFGYITASPLRGVSIESSNHSTAFGLSPWDAARAAEDTQYDENPTSLIQHWVTDTALTDRRQNVNEQIASAHDSIFTSVSDRALDQLASSAFLNQLPDGWLNQQYSLLQGKLAGTIPLENEVEQLFPFDDEEEDLFGVIDDEAADGSVTADAEGEIAFILQHGQQIEKLTSKDKTRFNELMQLAQDRFDSGEYFWAERRYDRALRFIPGHPFATAGLGHARIGAGLYLSASLALQSLLSLQPEMIDVTYAKNLLPPRLELVKAAVKITSRLNEKRDGGTYAFLLAYIGHQLGDREMVERGLSVFEEREGSNDPLVKLLHRIWL